MSSFCGEDKRGAGRQLFGWDQYRKTIKGRSRLGDVVRLRTLFSSGARFVCEALAKHVLAAPRTIMDREGDSPYLSRHYLIGGASHPDGDPPFDRFGNPRPGTIFDGALPFQLYLHKFHRGDSDMELHNHPWAWSVALVLAGGYAEERRVSVKSRELSYYRVIARGVLPFSVNVIRADDFHRVTLLEKDAWSLFLAGPKTQGWGFWSPKTGEFFSWREFLRRDQAPHARKEVVTT